MKFDTVIKNGKIVRPDGITEGEIGILNGVIAAVESDNQLSAANKTIDAGGKHILPGIIDNHVHLGCEHPLDIDIRNDTAAAAYGGVTTVANTLGPRFAMCEGSYTEKLDEWIGMHDGMAFTDSVLNATLTSEIQVQEIPLLCGEYGVTGYKFLMHLKGAVPRKLGVLEITDGVLYSGFKKIAEVGWPARAMIHAENVELIDRFMPKDEEKEESLVQFADSRPGFIEAVDIDRAASIARVTGAPLYIVHVSSAEGVAAVARAKEQGLDVIAETCLHYLLITKHVGNLGKMSPSLREETDNQALWNALNSGIIDCLGTDHTSTLKKGKHSIWEGTPGLAGVECLFPLLLSEGVNKGRISLEKLAELCCENNARAMGIYPQKGAIRVGSDADLVIVDLEKKDKLTANNLHHLSDFCIYEDWEVTGAPIMTMLRGNVTCDGDNLLGLEGVGNYIPRKPRK